MGLIQLKPGKDKPVRAHHPWIFSGAIARRQDVEDGETVEVQDAAGKWLARGYYNSRSQIIVRLLTWEQAEQVDRSLLKRRLLEAAERRTPLIDASTTNAFRLVNAESDLLPGLVVDRYADFLVVQSLTLGIEKRKTEIVELLNELFHPRGIYERSDVDVREKEGLGPAMGSLSGAELPEHLETQENGFRFLVDIQGGHKTGFYLDQRENRSRVIPFLPGNGVQKTLNVFSYTGGFAVSACAANPAARVVNLDASKDALALASKNLELNGFGGRGEFVEGDAFLVLRRYRDEGRVFETIILDPPKFVYSQSQLQAGLRGYKDINLLAIKLLKPGGTLVTFSCSGLVSADLFQKVVFGAAVDAGRDLQIIARLQQGSDHPVLLSFPESDYLKGLVCRLV